MSKFGRVFVLWVNSIKTLFTAPKIWIPILVMGGIHLTLLACLYFFPRPPLRMVFAPIIRRFFGETYLHYPYNFVVLPYLAKILRQSLVIFIDIYFIAVLAKLTSQSLRDRALSLKSAFKDALFKIFPLLAYSLLLVLILYVVQKVPPYVFKTIYKSPMIADKQMAVYKSINQGMFYALKFVGVVIQVFFVYTIPALVVGEYSLLHSVDRSFRIAARNFFSTLFLVLIPTAVVFGIEQYVKTPKPLIENYYPEVIFHILLVNILLYVMLSYLTIAPVTEVYLENSK